jgi:hypothetical protein
VNGCELGIKIATKFIDISIFMHRINVEVSTYV